MNPRLQEKIVHWFFFACGISVILILAGIFLMLIVKGINLFGSVSMGEFFIGKEWNPSGFTRQSHGIFNMILGTVMVTIGAMLIAVPLGIGTATYLSEVASAKARETLKPMLEILAAIPSVAFGFIGLVLVGPWIAKIFGLNTGLNALNGSILLAIMALPTIISVAEDAIRAVPQEYKEASYALGATRWETIQHVTLPAASPGIIAAVMLGTGRAIGETMTVLMVAGNTLATPMHFFDPVRTMTATVAIELGEVPRDTNHYYALFAIGAVLFVFSLAINCIAEFVSYRQRKRTQ